MSAITYNKLVRDKIPEIIEASGKKCEVQILSDEEYLDRIDAKLDEELAEYHKDMKIEELADLIEVIYAAAQARGYSIEELERIRLVKLKECGGFGDKIFLAEVIENDLEFDDWLIADSFAENKYNLFVKYCEQIGLLKIIDLKDFDFYSLLNIQGIGKSKVEDIIERYKQIISGQVRIDIKYGDELMPFEDINSELAVLNLEVLSVIGIRQKSLQRLTEAGFVKIGDIQGIPKFTLRQNMTAGDYDKLNSSEECLKMPLVKFIQSVLKSYSEDAEYKAALLREDGYTLQAIGDMYSVTRERIRQMIAKLEERVNPLFLTLKEAIQKNKQYIVFDDIVNVFETEEYNKIFLRWFKDNEELEYLEFADAFVELNGAKKHHEQDILTIATELIGDGMYVREHLEDIDSAMSENGYPFIDVAAFLNLVQEYGYHVYKDFIVKGKQSYGYLCSKIVESRFPNGIKLYEGSEDLKLLREYAMREFGDIGIADDDRAFSTRLLEYLVLSDKGAATAEANVHIDMELLEKIKEYIDHSSNKEIYYSSIFAMFESELAVKSNVDNYNFLHGVLKLYFSDEYDFKDRDFLTKNGEGLKSGRLSVRIRDYIDSVGRPVSKTEIRKIIPGITDIVIVNAITADDYLMQWEYNYYYSMSQIGVTNEDRQYLFETICEIMKANNDYCSDNMLYSIVEVERHNFLYKNRINDASHLYYVCMKLFSSEFDFRRPHITKKDLIENISVKNVALHLLGHPRKLLFSEYQKTAELLKWAPVTVSMVFAEIEQEYVRVNADEYIKYEDVSIDEDTLIEIEGVLYHKMKNRYLSLISFNEWKSLPKMDYEWNAYYLRSIIDKYLPAFKVIDTRVTDRRFEKGIVVNRDSLEMEYTDVVINALKVNGISQITENAMLKFLLERGLTNKAIPKELTVSDKIKYEDGMFSLV